MQFYSRGYIERAYKNYATLGTTNMETLIALGSLSSFALSLFFIFKYTVFGYQHPHKAIMEVNDALSSASLIVLTVTIGKHFEKRVKERIESITEEIFPESVLFQNMFVTVLEMRNRLLTVLN
jgi:cation transport ATPase